MKTFSFIGKMAAATAIVMSAACFVAKADDQIFDTKDFSKISVSGALDVVFQQGDADAVVAHGEKRDLDNLDIHVSGNTLYVGRRGGMHRSGPVKVDMVGKHLEAVNLSGASNLNIDTQEEGEVSLHVSGASQIKGKVRAKAIKIGCSGASNVKTEVDCGDVDLSCSGASNVKLSGKCANVSGSCSGASNVKLNGAAQGSVDVRCSGASSMSR